MSRKGNPIKRGRNYSFLTIRRSIDSYQKWFILLCEKFGYLGVNLMNRSLFVRNDCRRTTIKLTFLWFALTNGVENWGGEVAAGNGILSRVLWNQHILSVFTCFNCLIDGTGKEVWRIIRCCPPLRLCDVTGRGYTIILYCQSTWQPIRKRISTFRTNPFKLLKFLFNYY